MAQAAFAAAKVKGHCFTREETWHTLMATSGQNLLAFARAGVAEWVTANPFTYNGSLTGETVVLMANSLDIVVKRDWRIGREYLELLTKYRLGELVDEWKLSTNQA